MGFPNNTFIKMLLKDQILQIGNNHLFVARCGSELPVARCHGHMHNVNHNGFLPVNAHQPVN